MQSYKLPSCREQKAFGSACHDGRRKGHIIDGHAIAVTASAMALLFSGSNSLAAEAGSALLEELGAGFRQMLECTP